MKKILSALMFVICILSVNFCSARANDPYENNPNYLVAASYPNGKSYINLQSVQVAEYNPPHYQIFANAVFFSYMDGAIEHYVMEKRYNWNTKETFSRDDYGNWKKENIKGSDGASRRMRHEADALFRAAYGMDFYGY